MRRIALLAFGLGLLAAPASAQSLYGPGGLFLHPTASVPPKGRLTPGLLVLPQHHPVGRETRAWFSSSLDYGLTDDLEVGAVMVWVEDWDDREASVGGFAKYRFLRETKGRPAAAIGFGQLGFGDLDSRTAFLALRKQVRSGEKFPVILHLGVQYADYVDEISRHEFQPYGGVEVGLGRRLTFIAEGRPRMNAEFGTPLALTLSYWASEDWRVAVTWANNGLSDNPRFGVGVGFAIGTGK